MSSNMKTKVLAGNAMSRWVAKIASLCILHHVIFWVENPASSWLWRQLEWKAILNKPEKLADLLAVFASSLDKNIIFSA